MGSTSLVLSACDSRRRGCRREDRGYLARRTAVALIVPLRRPSRSLAGTREPAALDQGGTQLARHGFGFEQIAVCSPSIR
jgi:hypothetical protein